MKLARITFTDVEIAIFRICEAHGWDENKWHSLDDDYQERLLANDYRRQKQLSDLRSGFDAKIRKDEPIDLASYIAVILRQIV